MDTFKEVNDGLLLEQSLGRVWSHLNDLSRPFGIITAFRQKNTREENLRKNRTLAAHTTNAGYGYFFVDGYFIENLGKPDEVAVSEDSLFIIGDKGDNGRLKRFLLDMVKKFEQDSALFKPEESDQAFYMDSTGHTSQLGKWVPNKISQYMTTLRHSKSTFMFESVRFGQNGLERRYGKGKSVD